MLKQRTIQYPVRAVGIGLHSGYKVELVLRPALPDTGIRIPSDRSGSCCVDSGERGRDRRDDAGFDAGKRRCADFHHRAFDVGLCRSGNRQSACRGECRRNSHYGWFGIFFCLSASTGRSERTGCSEKIHSCQKRVEIREGEGANLKWARLDPFNGFKLDFFIEFNHPAIDATHQHAVVDLSQVSYVRDVSRARTFGFVKDVETLRGMGLDGEVRLKTPLSWMNTGF